MAVKTRMTLDEFLALPETEPASEFARGEVIQKPMPTFAHSLIQTALILVFAGFFQMVRSVRGTVVPELRHANRDEERAYLPDVSILIGERATATQQELFRGPIERVPDIAIEILSPDDRPGRVADKLAFYLRTGVPLVWLVDPELRRVDAYRAGEPSLTFEGEDVVTAEPVLAGFELPLPELFSVLDTAQA